MSNIPNLNQKIDLATLTDKELAQLADSLDTLDERKKYNKQEFLFPDQGQFPRAMYPKHMMFLKMGAIHRERALIAGNRIGKTYLSTAEVSYHLNGRYPDWWEGKKFNHPVKVWAVGKTHETTRDILQKYLLGSFLDIGSGMVPKADIIRKTSKPGVQDAVQDVYIKHFSNGIEDGISELSFKSYVQGVEAFMGTEQHVIALDEEPNPPTIYSECLTRTMTTKGLIICTFTPTEGLSDTVLRFLPGGRFPSGGAGVVE